ncbi:protein fuzzy homolog isoform X9 [Rattus norvegicus]|uniref:protein fuzzy homolog isoform X9 n=1 Tax=Rattus norvegicus TaxID=10116 RepID=UPI002FD85793
MGDDGPGSTVHLLCLAASSGVPLFCRSSSGGAPSRQQLPFSVIGSLNGVHMFGQNLDVQLNSARTEDTTVVWKNFHDSITLIALSSEEGTSELKLERMLHMVFGAMVLIVGLEELTNIRNVERLKKELRASYCLIDSFLGNSELIGDLTQCVDCVIPPEGSVMQVPHRLLTLTLLRGLELCLLCGPRPPLGELDPQVRPHSCWNAGGSLCWSPSGLACHWALGRSLTGSRYTAIFLGKARWLGPGPRRIGPACFPQPNCTFPQPVVTPLGTETLPLYRGALKG